MKKNIVILFVVLFSTLMGLLWWHIATRKVDPAQIQQRSDLSGTSVRYSWTGSFGVGDVHAFFSGDGEATLQIPSRPPIRIQLSEERYRQLLKCLSDNKFTEIGVRRRWGRYVFDIGRYEVVLNDGNRQTVVHVDDKHYVDRPELLSPIIEAIYAFNKDFGKDLSYGSFGTCEVEDTREITAAIIVLYIALALIVLLCVLLLWRTRQKGTKPEHDAASPPPT